MNAWVQWIGIDSLKPLLTALLLPPVPLLALIVLGASSLRRRPALGWLLLLSGVVLQWACSTTWAADAATRWLLDPPPALRDPERLKVQAPAEGASVIVVLGGGRYAGAEYHEVSLSMISMERLRYGIWLSRETDIPVAFSGGLSPGSRGGPSEGEIAVRIARDEFRHPLAWVEHRSRDTHENALHTIELLRGQPVGRLVLVTHDLHMPRALRHFERARDRAGLRFEIVPAPVGIAEKFPETALSDYYPTPLGIARMRYALREWLGIVAGA